MQRGAGGEAVLTCVWLLALQAGVSAGGVTNTAHTPWSQIPVRCSHCLGRASRDLQPNSSTSCMGMGVGNRVRGKEDFCWVRNGWNLTSPTNCRCAPPLIHRTCLGALVWAFSEAWPWCPHSGAAASDRHPWSVGWVSCRTSGHSRVAALLRHRLPLALPVRGYRDSPLLSLGQNPFACLPTWWEMQRDVC